MGIRHVSKEASELTEPRSRHSDGFDVGKLEGNMLGDSLGDEEGLSEGLALGNDVGELEGDEDGLSEGLALGNEVGLVDGISDGEFVGKDEGFSDFALLLDLEAQRSHVLGQFSATSG